MAKSNPEPEPAPGADAAASNLADGAADGPEPGASLAALPTAANVVALTRAATGSPCARCGIGLCGRDVVLSLVLGYRRAPQCHRCLADALREEPRALVARVWQYVARRDCYRAGWEWADRNEGFPSEDAAGVPPGTEYGGAGDGGRAARSSADAADGLRAPTGEDGCDRAGLPIAATYDAADMGCGDLVLELRGQLRSLEPGDILFVIARDPGAPVDIPAWCALTRHALRAHDHPRYWIERRAD